MEKTEFMNFKCPYKGIDCAWCAEPEPCIYKAYDSLKKKYNIIQQAPIYVQCKQLAAENKQLKAVLKDIKILVENINKNYMQVGFKEYDECNENILKLLIKTEEYFK